MTKRVFQYLLQGRQHASPAPTTTSSPASASSASSAPVPAEKIIDG
jgi:hypothetical protein